MESTIFKENRELISEQHRQFLEAQWENKHISKYFGQYCREFQAKLQKLVKEFYQKKSLPPSNLSMMNQHYIYNINHIQRTILHIANHSILDYNKTKANIHSSTKHNRLLLKQQTRQINKLIKQE